MNSRLKNISSDKLLVISLNAHILFFVYILCDLYNFISKVSIMIKLSLNTISDITFSFTGLTIITSHGTYECFTGTIIYILILLVTDILIFMFLLYKKFRNYKDTKNVTDNE